jgi:hypothetical protein
MVLCCTNVFDTVSFTMMPFDLPGKEILAGFTLQVAIFEVAEMKQWIVNRCALR